MKTSQAARILILEGLAEQRRQTIAALHRKIARLEEQLGQRDVRLGALQKEATTLRRLLRRIAVLARTGRERRAAPLQERAVGE